MKADNLSVAEALGVVLDTIRPLGTERVMLLDALDRTLAEPIRASRRFPAHDNSAMDGYALRAADTAGASDNRPAHLEIAGEVLTGQAPGQRLEKGQALRITTGAPIPEGADAVVMQERTGLIEGAGRVAIFEEAGQGQNIRRAGEDVAAGEQVLAPGAVLGPMQLGLLAALGRSVIEVHRRPRVAVLSSGDELVGIDGDHAGWRTVDSNAYMAAAQVRALGGIPELLPIASDDRGRIRELLESAARADCIVSTAGISVGPHDHVKGALDDLGFELRFWRVRQRPGSPLAFGELEGRPVFGLPGNPAAAAVCFELYVRPLLLGAMGRTRIFRPVLRARLTQAVRTKPTHTYFLRARLEREGEGWAAHPAALQSSGALKPLGQGNALIVCAQGREAPATGQSVPAIVLSGEALGLERAGIGTALGFSG